jgi:hypothetical protein
MAASMHSHGGMAAFSAATPLLQHTAAVPLIYVMHLMIVSQPAVLLNRLPASQ